MYDVKAFSLTIDGLNLGLVSDEQRIADIVQFCELHIQAFPINQFFERLCANKIKVFIFAQKRSFRQFVQAIRWRKYLSENKMLISFSMFETALLLSNPEGYCSDMEDPELFLKDNMEALKENAAYFIIHLE